MNSRAQQIIGLLAIVLGLFVGSTFETRAPVLAATAMACLLVYAQRNRRDEPKLRSWSKRWLIRGGVGIVVLGITAITAAWRMGSQLGESINLVYVGIEVVAHVCFFTILLAWVVRPRRGHVSMLPCGLVVVLLCAAGGGGTLSLTAQTTVALTAAIAFTVAAQIILGIKRGTRGEVFARIEHEGGHAEQAESGAWIGPVFSLLTLSVLVMATTTVANATNSVLPTIQDKLQEQLEATFDATPDDIRIGGTRYVSGNRLGSIRNHMVGSPQDIALRVNCNVVPGYLRGNVFDLYSSRRWYSAAHGTHRARSEHPTLRDRSVTPSGPAKVTPTEGATSSRRRFPLSGPQADNVVHLEVNNDPLKGNTVFLPLNTRWLEAVSSELAVSRHDVIRIGVDVSHPYVAGVGLTSVADTLSPTRRDVLLRVPGSAQQVTRSLANRLCGNLSTSRSKADAISQYFQQNFSYSLSYVRPPRETDALAYFLTARHPAHCEYFASATVLVLRSAGVPARYVTGYVADEYNDELSMWVARNRDAHAWAEAYDDATGLWFPVESTPGRTYQTIQVSEQFADDTGLLNVFGRDESDDDDTLLSWIIGWMATIRATDPLFLVFRIAQWPLFCFLVFYLWSRRYRSVRQGEAAIDYQARKMLKQVDRRLRKFALVRDPSETLYQFADRIDASVADATAPVKQSVRHRLEDAAQWYRRYATARYQGQLPEPLA